MLFNVRNYCVLVYYVYPMTTVYRLSNEAILIIKSHFTTYSVDYVIHLYLNCWM